MQDGPGVFPGRFVHTTTTHRKERTVNNNINTITATTNEVRQRLIEDGRPDLADALLELNAQCEQLRRVNQEAFPALA